jgi:sugar lactone lactonase YvrE
MQSLSKPIERITIVLVITLLGTILTYAHPGSGIVVDQLGQIYFLDTGSGLWKIDTRGGLSHLSPLRNHWLAIDAKNGFDQARLPIDLGRDWVITAAGTDPTLLISTDFPLAIGADGYLYYPSARETNVRILRKSPTGAASEFATLPRSVAGAALGWINGLATGPDGSLYYTEDAAVRRIARDGRVSTIATVTPLTGRPATPGSEKSPYLRGLKVDPNGVVYVAEAAGGRVLKITPDGKVSTILQLDSPWAPTDVAVFGDAVYSMEFSHDAGDDRTTWMPRIRKITPDGRSTVILTVDQMPGARPTANTVLPVSHDISSIEFLELLLRTLFLFA